MIEWRIDALAMEDDSADQVITLVRDCPLPCIVTCRIESEGGEFAGDEVTRLAILRRLIESDRPPRYVDLELAALQRDPRVRQFVGSHFKPEHSASGGLKTSLILSSHDFQTRPPGLIQRIEAMVNEPACAVVKVAWQARSLRDNLEAFELLRERRKPMIALCMGRFGLMSRVMAAKFGGLLTYAVPGDDVFEATAPGQPTIEQLVKLYRFDRICAATKVYGVIGWPVEHSLSPQFHNDAFEKAGHDGVYLPLPIPPEWEHFKATVGALLDFKPLDFRGASVTIPHKENLLRFVRERSGQVDELAQRVGAANTLIVNDDGSIECANTDAPAAVDAMSAGMQINRTALAGRKVAILGAGGMARAAAVGFASAGANVIIFNRTQDKARALAAELSSRGLQGKIVPGKPGRIDCGCFDIIINCTLLGMEGGPAPGESPLPPDAPLDENVTVMDTVYAPAPGQTPLLKQAAARGARTISGIELFNRQAAMQFERWTGARLPEFNSK